MPIQPKSDSPIKPLLVEIYAKEHYGIVGSIQKLPGEVDHNFLLITKDGQRYTLKISAPDTEEQELDFQAKILVHLSKKNLPFQTPAIIPTLNKKLFHKLSDHSNETRWIRLQTWVEGRLLDEANPKSHKLLSAWGATAAQLTVALQSFDHPAAHRFYKWNPSETLYSKKHLSLIEGEEEKKIATHFWNLFEQQTKGKLKPLRKSVNYNDAHEYNLLIDNNFKDPHISGVIDFGDVLFTETINELAITCAYASMSVPDPIEAAVHVIKGFHQCFPLEEKEIEVLFSLITARLLITVANAAQGKHHTPDNEYLQVSERPAWDLLKKLYRTPPSFALARFRAACGWEPCKKTQLFQEWISKPDHNFAQVIPFTDKKITPLDLSVGSLDLGNNSNFDSIPAFERTVRRYLEDQEAQIAFGGYGETRPVYTTDAYQVLGNEGVQWRTVHLGVDFWADAETPVFAPVEGRVHSFANNNKDRDFGPTIRLEHQNSDQLTFFTLYGHLSIESLHGLEKGQLIKKGQQIATFGNSEINGQWPPHLHFQIILDLLNKEGDFPGVAFPNEKQIWLSICPNPLPFYEKHVASPSSKNSSSTSSIIEQRNQHLGKNLSISYQKPLKIVRGFKQYLYDDDGRRYLDTVNNVAHVGHEHPKIVKAAQQQIGLLNTNTRYLHKEITAYAEELLATFPPSLSRVFFVNSGSEANELALRMVQANTGQKDMIGIEAGYHGNTGACIDISSYKFDGKGGNGAPSHTHVLPMPDGYRGIFKGQYTGEQYAEYAEILLDQIQNKRRNIAGFIAESILSCGGQIVLPNNYLKSVYKTVRSVGGLCIADEVQVGFGRVGKHFWGFELQGVVPDIVTLGKPIGNGHPLAALVTTQEVAENFANGMEYFNTFGGNPVSCSIGRKVLQVIKEEGLQNNAAQIGKYLLENLHGLKSQHPIIGDVRGEGLFLGFELVRNRNTLEAAPNETAYLANRMRERGILMSTDGPLHNVIKIKPPMCFDRSNVDFLIDNLDLVFNENFMKT